MHVSHMGMFITQLYQTTVVGRILLFSDIKLKTIENGTENKILQSNQIYKELYFFPPRPCL